MCDDFKFVWKKFSIFRLCRVLMNQKDGNVQIKGKDQTEQLADVTSIN